MFVIGQYDKVPDGEDDVNSLIDALIPPPTRGRGRAALVLASMALVVVIFAAWHGYWFRPNNTIRSAGWGSLGGGSSGLVELNVPIDNGGPRSFEITEANPSAPGLQLRSVRVARDQVSFNDEGSRHAVAVPLPVRLDPGQSATIRFDFDVTDCHAIEFGSAGMPLYVSTRLLDPSLPWWHQQMNVVGHLPFVIQPSDLPTNITVNGGDVGWPAALAVYACRGKW
jgi:hypothetical protein